jgi:hypothetical protein
MSPPVSRSSRVCLCVCLCLHLCLCLCVCVCVCVCICVCMHERAPILFLKCFFRSHLINRLSHICACVPRLFYIRFVLFALISRLEKTLLNTFVLLALMSLLSFCLKWRNQFHVLALMFMESRRWHSCTFYLHYYLFVHWCSSFNIHACWC